MPTSTPERRARWGIAPDKAERFLKERGYVLQQGWVWARPNPDHVITPEESDALWFLFEEWDYGLVEIPSGQGEKT